MITIKDFLEAINYRITEGSDYLWLCYGKYVYQLDSWGGNVTDNTVNAVFDRKTQMVYELQAWDYKSRKTYRWIHPEYIDAVKSEYQSRGLSFDISVDNEKFIDVDVIGDMLEKLTAISNNMPYDERIQIELDLDDSEMFTMMKMAHEKDMTLNQLVEHILTIEIERIKNEQT